MTLLLFVAGLVLLVGGADLLVRGASRLATAVGVTPLVVGLTVVSFGTSAPELAIGIKAAWTGQTDVALGNAIGSNIFNVLFILGIAALLAPLVVSVQLVRIEVPIVVAASVVVLLLGLDNLLSRLDGLLLATGLAAYTWLQVRLSRAATAAQSPNPSPGRSSSGWFRNTACVIGGLVLLAVGSQWVVSGAVAAANHLGISPLVTGLTIVAIGTSLPEVVTSVVASIRGERDIAVGNVIGSNLFNLLGVLGCSALLAPNGLPVSTEVLTFDLPVMIAVAFACLPLFFTGGRISRWEGGLLLGYYAAYTTYLILAVGDQPALSFFRAAMLYFVIPLTALTLLAVCLLAIKRK